MLDIFNRFRTGIDSFLIQYQTSFLFIFRFITRLRENLTKNQKQILNNKNISQIIPNYAKYFFYIFTIILSTVYNLYFIVVILCSLFFLQISDLSNGLKIINFIFKQSHHISTAVSIVNYTKVYLNRNFKHFGVKVFL